MIKILENQIEYYDFIGVYKNVFPENFCNHIIEQFSTQENTGVVIERKNHDGSDNHLKSDSHIDFNINKNLFSSFDSINTVELFFNGLLSCSEMYVNKFSILKQFNLYSRSMKVQKTLPSHDRVGIVKEINNMNVIVEF